MIPNLVNKIFLFSYRCQFISMFTLYCKRLFTKHMQVFFKCIFNHWIMKFCRSGNYNKVQRHFINHFLIVRISFCFAEFFESIEY